MGAQGTKLNYDTLKIDTNEKVFFLIYEKIAFNLMCIPLK